MSRVTISRLAQSDLAEIGAYIAQDNAAAAKTWIQKLRRTCRETIGKLPGCGTRCEHLLPGVRCFSVGNYVIFFRGRDPVEILRIVNGSRDFDQLTFE